MKIGDRQAMLLEVDAFRALPASAVAALAEACEWRPLAPGDVLMKQGAAADGLWVVVDGECEVRLRRRDVAPVVLARDGRGAILGEMALLTGAPRNADVVATKAGGALFVSIDAFRAVERREPAVLGVLTEMTARRLGRAVADGLADKVLGGYRIVRPVGRGATAVVYEAIATDTGERVALKMLSHRFARDAAAMELFERESRMLQSLPHPGVARSHGSFDAYGTRFLVMDYLDGPSLWEALSTAGALPPREARAVIGSMADALSYVHAQGVVHCDIKPANVMMTSDGRVRLTDFGIATTVESGTTPAGGAVRVCGTPRYMAPELFLGAPPSASADLYALGCLMVEAFTDDTPFPQTDLGALIRAKRTYGTPDGDPLPDGVPPDFVPVCSALLAPSPDDRVRSVAALGVFADQVSPGLVRRVLDLRSAP